MKKKTKIMNIIGFNKQVHWRHKKYNLPVVQIFTEEFCNHENGKAEKIYYFVMVRWAPDGSQHVCVDRTLPMNEQEMEVFKAELEKDDGAVNWLNHRNTN